MARGIAVYMRTDIELVTAIDWRVREDAEPLYDQLLGSEVVIGENWSEPATKLGLALLAAIYDHGFYHSILWEGSQFSEVERELSRLEAYWQTTDYEPERLVDLRERADYLRSALALASENNGVVTIT